MNATLVFLNETVLEMSWVLFDVVGTIAFALSGSVIGLTRRMDIFGIAILSIVTAVGGGILRDILIGVVPPMALQNPTNLLLSIVIAILFSLQYSYLPQITAKLNHKKFFRLFFLWSDTLGLGAFTVTGTLIGLQYVTSVKMSVVSSYVLPITLATLTAIGGGILRDILAQRVPVILHVKDIYATAAMMGSLVMCLGYFSHELDVTLLSWLGFFTVIFLRTCAIYFHWYLLQPHEARKKIRQTKKDV